MNDTITEIGLYYNEIPSAVPIEDVSYENFFKIHIYNDTYAFFNILKKINLINDSSNLNPEYFLTYNIDIDVPWVIASYKIYGTLNLWWLLCLINNVKDATQNPAVGTKIKVLKQQYVNVVINEIINQLKK